MALDSEMKRASFESMVPARTQVRKILDYQLELAKRDFEERRGAIYSENAAKGCLQSGATIRAVVRLMEEIGSTLVSASIEKISPIAQDTQSFADISSAFQDLWRFMETELQSTLVTVSARQTDAIYSNSATRSAEEMLARSRNLVNSKLELYRFTFTRPLPRSDLSSAIAPNNRPSLPTTTDKKGGRPPAEFWDDMWAAIAVSLYSGDLQPKSQADIQRAMLEWIETNGGSASESTVKSRARRLWDKLAALDE